MPSSLTASVFAVNPSGRAETPVQARAGKGTSFRYTLSEAALVRVTIERARPAAGSAAAA